MSAAIGSINGDDCPCPACTRRRSSNRDRSLRAGDGSSYTSPEQIKSDLAAADGVRCFACGGWHASVDLRAACLETALRLAWAELETLRGPRRP